MCWGQKVLDASNMDQEQMLILTQNRKHIGNTTE